MAASQCRLALPSQCPPSPVQSMPRVLRNSDILEKPVTFLRNRTFLRFRLQAAGLEDCGRVCAECRVRAVDAGRSMYWGAHIPFSVYWATINITAWATGPSGRCPGPVPTVYSGVQWHRVDISSAENSSFTGIPKAALGLRSYY